MVVTDGFTGNVLVKASEALLEFAFGRVRTRRRKQASVPAGRPGPARRPAGDAAIDWSTREYGGVPLLGVNGVVIVAHGRADAVAFKNALRAARETASSGLLAALSGLPKK